MIRLFITASLLFMQIFVVAQTISGIIMDESLDEPLIGATVAVKGTTIGTITDFDGKYSLQVDRNNGALVISYVGYETIEQVFTMADGQSEITLDFSMKEAGILLNEMVVTASRYERKLGEETVSIEVIKPGFIGDNNLTDASDILNKSPGVTVVDNQPNIRGGAGWAFGAGSRVLLLQDGMPIVQADAGRPSWGIIPVENIGQIEVIKGAASALYGSSAMNGIINIKTAFAKSTPETYVSLFSTYYEKPPPQFNDEGEEQPTDWWNRDYIEFAGLEDTVRVTDDIKPHPFAAGLSFAHRRRMGKSDNIDLTLGGFYDESQRWRYGEPGRAGRFSMHLRYRADKNMTFGLRSTTRYSQSGNFFLWRGLGADKYLPNSLTGAPTKSKVLNFSIDPYFEKYDDNGNRHMIQTRYLNIDNDNTNDQENYSDYVFAEYQYQRTFPDIQLTITGGATGSYNNVRAPLYGDRTLSGYNIGFYAQADKKFIDKLNVSLGMRLETNKQTEADRETKPVFRVGLNYQAHEATYVRFSFGQAYRFPSIAEKFISTELGSDLAIVPNPDLTSETGFSAEFGLKQGWQTSNKAFQGFLDFAVFYMRYFDMMEFNVDNDAAGDYLIVFKSKNVGDTFITGLEISVFAQGKWRGHPTNLAVGYTYIDPKFQVFDLTTKNGGVAEYNVLKYRYRHTFSANWEIDLKGFVLGTSWQYYSFMENLDRVFNDESGVLGIQVNDWRELRRKDGREPNQDKRSYRGDFILDLRAGWHTKNHRFAITFHIKNAANREYSLRPALIEATRNYSARIDIALN
jgi:iron complex outermembrane receptor protein